MSSKAALHSLLNVWYRDRDDPGTGDAGIFRQEGVDLAPDLPPGACMKCQDETRRSSRLSGERRALGPEWRWRVVTIQVGPMTRSSSPMTAGRYRSDIAT